MNDDYLIDKYEHAGLTVKILGEPYIEQHHNPREDVDGLLGVMLTEYKGYEFGGGKHDESGLPDLEETCPKCEGSGEIAVNQHANKDCPKCSGQGYIDYDLVTWLREVKGARVALPLFVYEHSGITMRTGGNLLADADNLDPRGRWAMDTAGWDTSTVGVIFDTPETREECGWETGRTNEEIEESLDAEIRYYAAYLEGSVCMYQIENADGEILGGCGGYLIAQSEDEKYMKEEANGEAEGIADDIKREAERKLEWECRDVVTV